jgi:hypothetical protein
MPVLIQTFIENVMVKLSINSFCVIVHGGNCKFTAYKKGRGTMRADKCLFLFDFYRGRVATNNAMLS